MPVTRDSAVPTWSDEVDVLGDVRPALLADPPTRLSWDLDVAPGTAVVGALALRPAAWEHNRGGVELVVELTVPGSTEPVARSVVSVDPHGRDADRRWVPWRLEVAAAGSLRLTVETQPPAGASGDFAWAVVGDPRLEVAGLAARHEAGPGSTDALAQATRGGAIAVGAGAGPTIALLLPVHDPEPALLDATLAAVLAQTSRDWALCIVDDGSKDPRIRERLERAAADEPRIRLTHHETAGGISAATNAALALTEAEFVATLDHDDVLAPDAIASMQAYLAAHPDTDLVYSDNDILASPHRFSASLKPGWSPDLLRALMYTLHLSVYRRAAVEAAGGWRSEFDGAQDHDLVLRLSERTDRIGHVPRVLYHWRAHAGSAALGELAKPEAYDRGRRAIAEHLDRTGPAGATAERLPEAGRYRVRYPRVEPVELVIPVRGDAADADLVATVRALLAVLRPDDRVALVAMGDAAAGRAASDALVALDDPRVSVPAAVFAEDGTRAPLGRLLSRTPATSSARHSTQIFFERAVAPGTPDAIDELAGHVEAGAGAAGGMIVVDGGRLVAGAMDFPVGLPAPVQPDADLGAPELHPALTVVSNRLAVRGVVAFPAGRTPLAAARDLDRLALVAASAAVTDAGGRVVWSPHARFVAPPVVADDLLVWPLAEAVALDRGARPDPYWNPQRWPDRGDATIPQAVHEDGPTS